MKIAGVDNNRSSIYNEKNMDSLMHLGAIWKPFAYAIVFTGMILEGDAVLFIAGFLAFQGYFDIVSIFFTVLSGVIIGDTLWYRLGVWIKDSHAFLGRWIGRIAQPFDERLLRDPLKTIFISKFTYGFNHAIIVRAGSLGIKWKNLEKSDILASLFWILVVGGLGYASGASFPLFKQYLKFGEIALGSAFLLLIAVEFFIAKKTKKKI